MYQVLFHLPIFGTPVYGYGVMLVVGFISSMYLAQFLARRSGLDPELFANAAIIGLVSGVVGARLSHVLENLQDYTRPELSAWQNFVNAINIREGGLTYYGGFILATICLIGYALLKKVPLRLGMDIIAPCVMIGLGCGRIGCYLNGCCYGAECQLPWAVEFPYRSDAFVTEFEHNDLQKPIPRELLNDDSRLAELMDKHGVKTLQEPLPPEQVVLLSPNALLSRDKVDADPHLRGLARRLTANPVHPAEIYSSVVAFIIALFLFAYFTLPHTPGRVFAAMVIIEGAFRYVLELVRVEPARIGAGTPYLASLPPQSFSMIVSVVLIILGVGLWFLFGAIARARGETKTRAGFSAVPASA